MAKRSSGNGKGAGKPAPSNFEGAEKSTNELISVVHFRLNAFSRIDCRLVEKKLERYCRYKEIENLDIDDIYIEIDDLLIKFPGLNDGVGEEKNFYFMSLTMCLLSKHSIKEADFSQAFFWAAEAMYWAGLANGVVMNSMARPKLISSVIGNLTADRARKAAVARNEKDPKRLQMKEIKKLWVEMHETPIGRRRDAQFAREMALKFHGISEGSIKNAIPKWRKELESSS